MKKTVLYIDDDIDDQLIMEQAIYHCDIDVKFTSIINSLDTLKHLHTTRPYDLIFLDLNMPILDGFDILKLIKVTGKDIPVYILSTSNSKKDKETCLEMGAKGYINKPSTFGELCSALNEVLERELLPV